ncbi:hypothetical protein D3C83_163300 [compost metagenome]
MIKAKSVPMLTSCPSTAIGISPAKIATAMPTTIVEIHGVLKRGWIAEAHFGSSPSFDIV